ncbi:MAG TPA: glycoside hydrolase family 27 protein, partial [Candidatus Baltobacteraceae bacterium]|nr:glycoside hydrolase family 27 protein [Candidatus Baltobacteraceae bacterium]
MPRRVRFLTLTFAFALLPLAQALTNNVALTPPMGWNDWNSYGCGITEGDVTNTAAVMVANGMKAAGYQFVNIDDCGLSGRDAYGVAVANGSKFHHGIKWLADYVHSLGLKQGLYSDRGTNTCSSFNSPGSYGYEYLDAFTYASWGGDYLKEDNC